MQNFETTETFNTPRVKFSLDENLLELEGRLLPEDPQLFFDMLAQTLGQYDHESRDPLTIRIYLYYYNTSSGKRLLHFLQSADEMNGKRNQYKVEWVFEEGDEDTFEEGEDFKSQLDLEFNIVEVEG